MFGLGPATKIYVAAAAVDMRKGFKGLYGLVRDQLGQDERGYLYGWVEGFPEAIEAIFPSTLVQTCIVHLIRAT